MNAGNTQIQDPVNIKNVDWGKMHWLGNQDKYCWQVTG